MLNNDPKPTKNKEEQIRFPRVRKLVNAFRKVLRRDQPSANMIQAEGVRYGYAYNGSQIPFIRSNVLDLADISFTIKTKNDHYTLMENELLNNGRYDGIGKFTRGQKLINGVQYKTFNFQIEKGFEGQIVLSIPSQSREIIFNVNRDDNWQELVQTSNKIEMFKEFNLVANGGVLLGDLKKSDSPQAQVYFDRNKLNLTEELASLNLLDYSETFLDMMRLASANNHDYRETLSSSAHETLHAITEEISKFNPLIRKSLVFNQNGDSEKVAHNRSYAIILPSKGLGYVCEHPPAFVSNELLLEKTINSYPLKAEMKKSFNDYAQNPAFNNKKHLCGFIIEELNACMIGNRVTRETLKALEDKGFNLSEDAAEARLQAFKMIKKDIANQTGVDEAAPVFELAVGVLTMAKILHDENREFYDKAGYQLIVDLFCSEAIKEFKSSEDLVLRNGYENSELKDPPISVNKYLSEIRTASSAQALRKYIKEELPSVAKELELK